MARPYDPTRPLQVHVVSQSPHTFAYRLFIALPHATVWSPLDSGDITTPEQAYGPFPAGTRFAYTLLLAGNQNTSWRTETMLSQLGELLTCSPTPDSGTTDAKGAARRDVGLTIA